MEKKKPKKRARLIPTKCIACGARCQMSCPKDAIEMTDKGEPLIDLVKCIGCNKCVKICPAEALELYQPHRANYLKLVMTPKNLKLRPKTHPLISGAESGFS